MMTGDDHEGDYLRLVPSPSGRGLGRGSSEFNSNHAADPTVARLHPSPPSGRGNRRGTVELW